MTKLLRTLLTTAVLVALGVRLRRRVRLAREAGLAETARPPEADGTPGDESGSATARDETAQYGEDGRRGEDPLAGGPASSPTPGSARRGRPRPRRRLWGATLAIAGSAAVATTVGVAVIVVPQVSRGQSPPPSAGAALPLSARRGSAVPSRPAEPSATPPAFVPVDCLRQEEVLVRPLDPGVTRLVNQQWRRIEGWLARNAPRTGAALAGPARVRAIAVAEAQMGLRFPDDLRASLLRHDGGLVTSLGVREIRDRWRSECAARGERAAGFLRLIPVDQGLVVQADTGRLGVVGVDSAPDFSGGRPSYLALLREVADALEWGRPLDGRRPTVHSDRLNWVEIS